MDVFVETHYFVFAFGAANGTEMIHFTLKVIEVSFIKMFFLGVPGYVASPH